MRWFTGWLLLATGACTWEPPLLDNEFGPPPLLNSISGTVVFAGDLDEVQPTFITIFDARNPGPPLGTGGPVTVAAVRAEDFNPDLELPAAQFGVSQLPDGEYFVNALMDVDGDFNPSPIEPSGALAGATCGDWLGSHVTDLVTLNQQTVTVAGGVAVEDVTVLVGQELIFERPVFGLAVDQQPISLATLADDQQIPPTFTVRTQAVDADLFGPNPLELGPSCAPDPKAATIGWTSCDVDFFELLKQLQQDQNDALCNTSLLVELVDADGDGLVDPYPAPAQAAAGLLDIWPRVFLQYLPPADAEPTGETWATQAFPLTLEIQGAVLQGGTPDLIAPIGTPLLASDLSVTLTPIFQRFWEGGQLDDNDGNGPYDVINLQVDDTVMPPAGAWTITVISQTGQTWTVPNSLASPEGVVSELDVTSQGIPLVFVP
ncbi:MAG: hypothetical protein AAGA48_39690 [Myxococcota bacterium]